MHKHSRGNSELLEVAGRLDINCRKARDQNHSCLAVKRGRSKKFAVLNFSLVNGKNTFHWVLNSIRRLKSEMRKGKHWTGNWKNLHFGCLVTSVGLLLAEAGVNDRRPGYCWVSSFTLPHISLTRFHICRTAITLSCFTVGLRVCNCRDRVCSYTDPSLLPNTPDVRRLLCVRTTGGSSLVASLLAFTHSVHSRESTAEWSSVTSK